MSTAAATVTTLLQRPVAAASSRTISEYFVVMIDYGRRGREAIVDPEMTRRDVIACLVSGEYSNVLWIHRIANGLAEDVTLELQLAASVEMMEAA